MAQQITAWVTADSLPNMAKMLKKAAEQLEIGKMEATIFDERYGHIRFQITHLNTPIPTSPADGQPVGKVEAGDESDEAMPESAPELGGRRAR